MVATHSIVACQSVVELPLDEIALNPYQPRSVFDINALEDLSASIAEYGVLQPISVRIINGSNYELVAGERRLRASKMAGRKTIPAVVVDISDQDSGLIALIENLQRQDLNYMEEAVGFMNLITDYGFTQEQLAQRIGKKQSTIANKLRLLKLPRFIQRILIENGLSERHARALLKLPNEKAQADVLARVIKLGLNVNQTEALVEHVISGANNNENQSPRETKPIIKDIRLFTNTVRQALEVMNKSGLKTTYDVEETGDGCFISIAVVY